MLSNRKDLSFTAGIGIRQGCPLSPLISGVIADPFLRVLGRKLGRNGLIRAFADDNGLALRNCLALQVVLDEYEKYAIFSNLNLNLKKCYVVPLFPAVDKEQARAHIVGKVPGAGGMCYEWYAIYLGIYLGPGAGDIGWEAPILKYIERARQWGAGSSGLFVSARHYAIFCVSVLQF